MKTKYFHKNFVSPIQAKQIVSVKIENNVKIRRPNQEATGMQNFVVNLLTCDRVYISYLNLYIPYVGSFIWFNI